MSDCGEVVARWQRTAGRVCAEIQPAARLDMRCDLTLAGGLHEAVGNVFFGVGGDNDVERHDGTTNHRLFLDGDRP
jgi:hypothetical protein